MSARDGMAEVLIHVDKRYGLVVFKPANAAAEIFAAIAGTKELTPAVIDRMQKLGAILGFTVRAEAAQTLNGSNIK